MSTNGAKNRFLVFAERFHELRGEMTQDEFALFLDVSRTTVFYYENGTRLPDALVIRRICEKCNVSADWLLGMSEVKEINADIAMISRKTGLSGAAIQKTIQYYVDYEKEDVRFRLMNPSHILSRLIESNVYRSLLINMAGLIARLTSESGREYSNGDAPRFMYEDMEFSFFRLNLQIKQIVEELSHYEWDYTDCEQLNEEDLVSLKTRIDAMEAEWMRDETKYQMSKKEALNIEISKLLDRFERDGGSVPEDGHNLEAE